jgi:hypothetical protein
MTYRVASAVLFGSLLFGVTAGSALAWWLRARCLTHARSPTIRHRSFR